MTIREKVHQSGGSVFADLGVPHPERAMARARVMSRISEILRERGLTQQEAARVLGVPQSKVSCLMHGKLNMFSLERLFELLNALSHDVEIVIGPAVNAKRAAATRVSESQASMLQKDREELIALSKRLTPGERLKAHYEHSQLLAQIYQAGVKYRSRAR